MTACDLRSSFNLFFCSKTNEHNRVHILPDACCPLLLGKHSGAEIGASAIAESSDLEAFLQSNSIRECGTAESRKN